MAEGMLCVGSQICSHPNAKFMVQQGISKE